MLWMRKVLALHALFSPSGLPSHIIFSTPVFWHVSFLSFISFPCSIFLGSRPMWCGIIRNGRAIDIHSRQKKDHFQSNNWSKQPFTPFHSIWMSPIRFFPSGPSISFEIFLKAKIPLDILCNVLCELNQMLRNFGEHYQ